MDLGHSPKESGMQKQSDTDANDAIFKSQVKAKCVSKCHLKIDIVLQKCPGLHGLILQTSKNVFVWYRSLQKAHHDHLI